MKVFLVFTDAGLYGVYKTRKLAKYAADKVSGECNVRVWIENRPVIEGDPKTGGLFGEDEDNDIQ